jgi:hypothetical protein
LQEFKESLFFLLGDSQASELLYAENSAHSAHKIQTPGNHPKERIQRSENGESWKSRI